MDMKSQTAQHRRSVLIEFLPRLHPIAFLSVALLAFFAIVALIAPWIANDPTSINPSIRLKFSEHGHWFGTDYLGRDMFSRAIFGTQRSLIVGFSVATAAALFGLIIGVMTGYFRRVDKVVVPMLDGMMAIPGLLLAVALVSLLGANLLTIIIAITVPEVPRMARVVRGVVLSVREQQFISAAVSVGTPTPLILWRHIVPNTVGAVTVQTTYVCAAAILTEAILSFLGVGGSASPSWGGMIAESRNYFQVAPWLIAYPAILLSLLVLSVNTLGDQLREVLDPRFSRRVD